MQKSRSNAIFVLIAVALGGCDVASNGDERLLPSAQAKLLTVEAATDARAVELRVANESDWVVTAAEVVCKAKSESTPVGCWVNPISGIDAELIAWQAAGHQGMPPRPPQAPQCYSSIYGPAEVLKERVTMRALSHSVATLYTELEVDKVAQLGSCYVIEPRGHKNRWYEFF